MHILSTGLAVIRLLRPRQWVKNVFVLAPLFFAPGSLNTASVNVTAFGFLAFSVAAGAAYAFNDILDRQTDRYHVEKRRRPVAAGEISLKAAARVAALAAIIALAIAMVLAVEFAGILLIYLVLNAAYSIWLKHVLVVDVAIITLGFVLRVYAGGVLIDVEPSAWIVVMTALLALFLALAKRQGTEPQRYPPVFLKVAIPVMLAGLLAGYVAYTMDANVMARLGIERLYVTVPLVVFGIFRYLQLAFAKKLSSDPTELLFSDALLPAIVACWVATLAALIYL